MISLTSKSAGLHVLQFSTTQRYTLEKFSLKFYQVKGFSSSFFHCWWWCTHLHMLIEKSSMALIKLFNSYIIIINYDCCETIQCYCCLPVKKAYACLLAGSRSGFACVCLNRDFTPVAVSISIHFYCVSQWVENRLNSTQHQWQFLSVWLSPFILNVWNFTLLTCCKRCIVGSRLGWGSLPRL